MSYCVIVIVIVIVVLICEHTLNTESSQRTHDATEYSFGCENGKKACEKAKGKEEKRVSWGGKRRTAAAVEIQYVMDT